MGKFQRLGGVVLLAALSAVVVPTLAHGQGLILGGAGAMHRSMAGASTAYGVDALGAQYWNPAAIGSLSSSEVVIGGEAIIPDIHVGSTVPAGAFGTLGPDSSLSGYTRSDSGVGLTSGVALVYREVDSPLTFGLGLVTLAGGGVNFPGNPGNPILAPVGPLDSSARRTIRPLPSVGQGAVNPLTPAVQNANNQINQINQRINDLNQRLGRVEIPTVQPITLTNARFNQLIQSLNGRIDRINQRISNVNQRLDQVNPGLVLGPQAGSLMILSVMPSAAYQVTDRLVVAGGPMIDLAVVSFDPATFGPIDFDPRSGLASFPTGSHTRPFWGGGFRAGFTYRVFDHLHTGFSFTSPQWFETWKFNARTQAGEPVEFSTQFTLPMVLSAGMAYDGIDRLLLSADLRWFDYRATQLIGEPVREGGAGWDSVWAVAVGSRYQLTDEFSLQLGYLFNENPVPSNLAAFNLQLPALTQHTVSAGVAYQLNDWMMMSLAYIHGFKNSVTGSIFPLAGTSTTLDSEYDSIAFGMHIKFGGPSGCRTAPACAVADCEMPDHVQVTP